MDDYEKTIESLVKDAPMIAESMKKLDYYEQVNERFVYDGLVDNVIYDQSFVNDEIYFIRCQ